MTLKCHKIQKGDLRQPGRPYINSAYSFVMWFLIICRSSKDMGEKLSEFFFKIFAEQFRSGEDLPFWSRQISVLPKLSEGQLLSMFFFLLEDIT